MQSTICTRCNGDGTIAVFAGAPAGDAQCPACRGTGRLEQEETGDARREDGYTTDRPDMQAVER